MVHRTPFYGNLQLGLTQAPFHHTWNGQHMVQYKIHKLLSKVEWICVCCPRNTQHLNQGLHKNHIHSIYVLSGLKYAISDCIQAIASWDAQLSKGSLAGIWIIACVNVYDINCYVFCILWNPLWCPNNNKETVWIILRYVYIYSETCL